MSHVNCFVMSGMTVNEAVTENEDGSYTIFINDSLSPFARTQAYKHALNHIYRCDFNSEQSVDQIELETHLE